MGKRKTKEQYIEEIRIKNPTVKLIGEYKGTNISTKHYCTIHDIYWDAQPANILLGQGCKKCGMEKQIIARRKTHEDYVRELQIKNPKVIAIGIYHNYHTKILHKCLICGTEWNCRPADVLRGSICPKCANNKKLSKSEYQTRLNNKGFNIDVIEDYVNINTPIKHRCRKHDLLFVASPVNVYKGKSCKLCYREKFLKSTDEYIDSLYNIHQNNIQCVGEYNGMNNRIMHKCNICGNEWLTSPKSLLQGNGCPKCRNSKGEKAISNFLLGHNINFIAQKRFSDCVDKRSLPFDFYLPKDNICIEFDGEQHFTTKDIFGGKEAFEKQKLHDKIKDDYCKEHGIKLLRIPYYKDIEEELNNFLFI